MAKIKFVAPGYSVHLDCEDGTTCSEAMEIFQKVTGRLLDGVDLYANGNKVENLNSTAPRELVALKSKHESN